MGAFSTAFTQFFTMLTRFFTGLSYFAESFENIGHVAAASSGTYKDQALHDQQVAANLRKAELLASTQATPAITTTSANEVEGIAQLKALTEQLASLQAAMPAKAQ